MTTSYRGNPAAVQALVQPDRVHRDLYIDPELFELEQQHFFANTWNYVGHDSQIPKAGDYIRNEIAGQPLIVVRHSDDTVRVLMNRCAHKGSRLVSAPCGNTGRHLPLPVPRLDLPHRRLAAVDAAEERLRRHRAARMRGRARAWPR